MQPPIPPLRLGARRITLGERTRVMGILNLTADSFSGDGLLHDPERVLVTAAEMVRAGADLLDVGGETAGTRRGPIPASEEIDRIAPWIERLARELPVPIAVNTWRAPVAAAAIDAGATLIDDIGGLADPALARLAADHGAGLVIMHLRGQPKVPHLHEEYENLLDDMRATFRERIRLATECGLAADQIVLDPGIDFAKRPHHNLLLLHRLRQLTECLPHAWLAAVSRKTVIGDVLGRAPARRDPGTAACVAAAIRGGCHIIRVHNVPAMRDVARAVDALQRPG